MYVCVIGKKSANFCVIYRFSDREGRERHTVKTFCIPLNSFMFKCFIAGNLLLYIDSDGCFLENSFSHTNKLKQYDDNDLVKSHLDSSHLNK